MPSANRFVVAHLSDTKQEIVYDNGGVYLGEASIGFARLIEYDNADAATWASEETRAWARDWAAALGGASTTSCQPRCARLGQ